MSNYIENFESYFGFPPPAALLNIFTNNSLMNSLPAGFRFRHVGFPLEIQYLLDISDPKHYDVDHRRLSFAVNTDGFELLVDLNTKDLEILQNEYGDIDNIGITLNDLLNAERYSL
jgi:hypothetical protein